MKFCSKCGTQLQDDCQFCYKCGTSTSDLQSFTPMQQHAPIDVDAPAPLLPPRKKPKLLFILPIVLVLLIGGGLAYYFLGVAPTPLMAFAKANEMFFTGAVSATGANAVEGRMQKENYEASSVIKITEMSGVDEQLKAILTNFSLIFDMIKVKNDGGLNMSVKMGDSELAQVSAILTEEKLYAGLFQTGSIQTASYVDVPGDENTPALQRLMNTLTNAKTDERMEKLMIRARDMALQSVDLKWFSISQGSYEDISGKGGDVKATAIKLTLDTDAVKAFIKSFADKLEKDPTFYDDLQKVISDSVKDAPKTAADEVKNALKKAGESIVDESFKLSWTAYQNNGKTEAIHIALDINAEQAGKADIKMQSASQAGKTKIMSKINIAPEGETPAELSASFENEEKTDGNSFRILINFASGDGKGSASISGDTKFTKKSANEYTGKTTLVISADVPGMTEQGAAKISLGVDSSCVFGDTGFKTSRYFKLDELKGKAAKAQNIEELLGTLFSGAQGLAGGLSGLVPDAA